MGLSKNQPEFLLQKSVCRWLSAQHNGVLFMSDTIASVKLTMPQQARNKSIQKHGFHCPDLMIFQPNENYHGLFIELKAKSPYKKNGELLKDTHLEDQKRTIDDLNSKGYFAVFSWSFDQTKDIINWYLLNQ